VCGDTLSIVASASRATAWSTVMFSIVARISVASRIERVLGLPWVRRQTTLTPGTYVRDPNGGPLRATCLVVVTLAGDRVSAFTRFGATVLTRFDLALSLAG
jgi:hypothetical protein